MQRLPSILFIERRSINGKTSNAPFPTIFSKFSHRINAFFSKIDIKLFKILILKVVSNNFRWSRHLDTNIHIIYINLIVKTLNKVPFFCEKMPSSPIASRKLYIVDFCIQLELFIVIFKSSGLLNITINFGPIHILKKLP